MKKNMKTSVILLAGGIGTRVQSTMPKQFLELGNHPIAYHSFKIFLDLSEIDEIIVVCQPHFEKFFHHQSTKPVFFALPGERRQDSVFNGLKATSYELICIHDAARPFIDQELVLKVLKEGQQHGAATLGMPVKFTVKESDLDNFVKNTPDRSHIWEIQTPQVLQRDLLIEGFNYANQEGITVTDDVSLAELVNKKVKLVEGSHTNLKITVPADLAIANQIFHDLKR